MLGKKIALPPTLPALEQPAYAGGIGYHIRRGDHGTIPYDWERYMDFADLNLR